MAARPRRYEVDNRTYVLWIDPCRPLQRWPQPSMRWLLWTWRARRRVVARADRGNATAAGSTEVAAGRLLARWDARQVWRNDQSLSPAARLASSTRHHARPDVGSAAPTPCASPGRGDRRGVRPAVGRSRRAARRRRRPSPRTLRRRRGDARGALHHAAVRRRRTRRQVLGPSRRPRRQRQRRAGDRRQRSVSETIDGTVVVDATLTGVDARVFVDELRRLTDAQRHTDAAGRRRAHRPATSRRRTDRDGDPLGLHRARCPAATRAVHRARR